MLLNRSSSLNFFALIALGIFTRNLYISLFPTSDSPYGRFRTLPDRLTNGTWDDEADILRQGAPLNVEELLDLAVDPNDQASPDDSMMRISETIVDNGIDDLPESTYRIALVMPCTFSDILFSLPMAIMSAIDSMDPYDEVTIVFGIETDIEEGISNALPEGINVPLDNVRAHFRNFILKWAEPTPGSESVFEKSRDLNRLAPEDSITPTEVLDALRVLEWSDSHTDAPKEGQSKSAATNFGLNIYDSYKGYPTLDDLASKLPKFKIVLNRHDHPWAAVNRQFGSEYSFTDRSSPRDNDIISYVDCDDFITPTRSFMVLQAFKENPDAVEFGNGAAHVAFDKEEPYYESHIDDKHRVALDGCLPSEDTPAWREALFERYFDFRAPEVKEKYRNFQQTREFRTSKDDEYIEDPRDLKRNNSSSGKDPVKLEDTNFTWWLGCKSSSRITDTAREDAYMVHNGHTSWRHSWLINQIGGLMLASRVPLSYYTGPMGTVKRRFVQNLINWDTKLTAEEEKKKADAAQDKLDETAKIIEATLDEAAEATGPAENKVDPTT